MSYSVSGTMITLTRGDTFTALITITDSEGNQYVPVKGDRIRFAMKTDYEDGAPLLIKEIPIDRHQAACIWQVCLRHRADKSNGRSGHLHYQSNS